MYGVGAPARLDVGGWLRGQIRSSPLAAGQGRQILGHPGRVGEDRRRGQVSEQGHARQHAPALAEHEHRVERVEPGAAVGFVDQQSRPARLAGCGPQVRQRAVIAVECFARGLEGLRPRKRSARGLAQELLLV